MSVDRQLVDLRTDTYIETEKDKWVDEMLERYYDKHYDSFEEFEKDFWEKVYGAIDDIEAGNGIPMECIVNEMRQKYGIPLPHIFHGNQNYLNLI